MFGRKIIGCFIIFINFSCNFLIGISEETDLSHVVENVQLRQKILSDLGEMKSLMENINRRFLERNINGTDTEMSVFDIRFDPIPEKCKTKDLPINCDQATACIKRNGIYKILVEKYSKEPFLVECDAKTLNGGWLLIQRRHDGSENFYRDWIYYKDGFGNIQSEFFIGLDKLHALTNYLGPQELLVVIEEVGVYKYARYSSFAIGDEEKLYILKSLGKYSGTAGDSLQAHINMEFTSRDRDHDKDVSNCAQRYTGAWWYNKCHLSNLNGKYGDNTFGKGINWHTYKGSNHSITNVKMMIRRRRE
ncbi:ficolin-2 [Stomoxys calcitrans]|uniref:Fibrinogen C-terminal domain-containing protein n=1 Tax=Stomoxys calcitrans TaxID=35570 RepID=A0A1I8PAT1_STOCA|nr:ficolin-2 [Stomoxys calcitrans]